MKKSLVTEVHFDTSGEMASDLEAFAEGRGFPVDFDPYHKPPQAFQKIWFRKSWWQILRLWQQTWCCCDVTVRLDRRLGCGFRFAAASGDFHHLFLGHLSMIKNFTWWNVNPFWFRFLHFDMCIAWMAWKCCRDWRGLGRSRFWCWSLYLWWLLGQC